MNTQTEEHRAENQAFQRMFEPKLIHPKLNAEGLLTFSTEFIMSAYEVMVSSKELNKFKIVAFSVDSTEASDFILETTFLGEVIRDPVVMVRILQLAGKDFGLWQDVDVSEYISAHQQPTPQPDVTFEKIQLANLPEVIDEPVNGKHRHGVNGNGDRLPWWQLGRQSIRALVEKTKLKLWPKRNGHDENQQETTTTETGENEIMKTIENGKCSNGGSNITIQPNTKAIGYMVRLVEDGASPDAEPVGRFEIDSIPEVMKMNWVEKMGKLLEGHPSRKSSYVLEVLVLEGDAGKDVPVKIGSFTYTSARLAKMFKVSVVEKLDQPTPTLTDASEPAELAPTPTLPEADATQLAPATTPIVCRFPNVTDLVIEPVAGASKFTVEVMMISMDAVIAHTEQVVDVTFTIIKDVYKKMKFQTGHPSKEVSYKLRITALTDTDQIVGTPAVWPVTGSEIQKALDDGKPAAQKPDITAVSPVPTPTPAPKPVTVPSPKKSLPQAGINNLGERLDWIEFQTSKLENPWFADNRLKPNLKKVEGDIRRLMVIYGNDESNLVVFMERTVRANTALAEARAKLDAPKTLVPPVAQPQATAPTAQTQVPPAIVHPVTQTQTNTMTQPKMHQRFITFCKGVWTGFSEGCGAAWGNSRNFISRWLWVLLIIALIVGCIIATIKMARKGASAASGAGTNTPTQLVKTNNTSSSLGKPTNNVAGGTNATTCGINTPVGSPTNVTRSASVTTGTITDTGSGGLNLSTNGVTLHIGKIKQGDHGLIMMAIGGDNIYNAPTGNGGGVSTTKTVESWTKTIKPEVENLMPRHNGSRVNRTIEPGKYYQIRFPQHWGATAKSYDDVSRLHQEINGDEVDNRHPIFKPDMRSMGFWNEGGEPITVELTLIRE